MAQNDQAVITASRGFIFVADPDTPPPTPAQVKAFDPETGLMQGWDSVGHTARDELPEMGFDGGDTEVRGTWQSAAFREVVTEAPADYVTFNVHQFDRLGLSLYYGVSDPGPVQHVFAVQEASARTTEKALLIIIVDGTVRVGFHAGRTSIRREAAISLSTDGFAYLPLRSTFLKGNGPLFEWISQDTGVNPTVAPTGIAVATPDHELPAAA
jgi:hypothetical protein